MIQSVTNFKLYNSKNTNGYLSSKCSNKKNLSQPSFSKSKNPSFTGVNSSILVESGSKIAKKAVSNIANESRKELPITDKPVIAKMEEQTKQMIWNGIAWVADKTEMVDPTPISTIVKGIANFFAGS